MDPKTTDSRMTLLPDQRFLALLAGLQDRLAEAGRSIKPSNFMLLLDDAMRRVLHLAFRNADADEGTVWIVAETGDALVPVLNTGPNGAQFVGRFRQPLSAGLISMVFSNEQPFLENDVTHEAAQDKTLDSMLGSATLAMIACPFYFLDACRGVISCVQLGTLGSGTELTRGFQESHRAEIRHAATILGRLIDNQVLRAVVGLRHD
jgi:hypothetical protein